MEELKQIIIEAIIEGHKKSCEMGYCGDGMQLINGKDPYELLTVEQVKEETGFGLGTVRKMFADPEFNAQRYVSPQKVARKSLYDYTLVHHDNLCERK